MGKIAAGSLRNKLLLLLPAALASSYFLPWMITPLLMLGGAYLCYEGTEKLLEAIIPHQARAHEARLGTVALDPHTFEDEKVASARLVRCSKGSCSQNVGRCGKEVKPKTNSC